MIAMMTPIGFADNIDVVGDNAITDNGDVFAFQSTTKMSKTMATGSSFFSSSSNSSSASLSSSLSATVNKNQNYSLFSQK